MKKILLSILVAIGLLLAILFYNYLTVPSKQLAVQGEPTDVSRIVGAEERLAKSITFKTVSYEDDALMDYQPFLDFHQFLQEAYPQVFEVVELELVNDYSLLLKWNGQQSDLKPGVFLAHQDVVPVLEDTRDMWSVDPFEGKIIDGVLWGRGTIDDKINLLAQLEAIDFLLEEGFTPERDLYFAFGHDEEIGGEEGAAQIAQLLHSRGIEAEFVVDEGGFITYERVPGVSQAVALIGTSEKGFLNLELSTSIEGGHSSMPEGENSIQAISRAIQSLQDNPFSAKMSPSVQDFIEYIAPHSNFINRLAMSNLWLFKPLVYKIYSATGAGSAMVRTTMTPTIIQAGEKSNVIPDIAKAIVNYRLLPGTTVADAIAHTEKAINNPAIKVTALREQKEATEVSPIDNEPFKLLSNAIHLHFEDVVVAPFLMIAATDSRNYDIITSNIYKFSPMIDPIGFHGVDERLDLKDYSKTIGFYVDFMKGL